jgi:uncharacterized protein (DUF433 family)
MVPAIRPHIRLDEQGVAWIEGTATKVIEIALTKIVSGLTPEELQAELPHLSLAQIQAALAYYSAHQEDLDAEIERRRRWVEEMRAQSPNPITREELLARKKGTA